MTDRTRIDRDPLELRWVTGALDELWHALCALADAAGDLPWTIVGGQMVLLHGLEHGRVPPRLSDDIDAAVDVRAAPGATRRLVEILQHLGYRSAGATLDGHAYRFSKQAGGAAAHVDVVVGEGDDLVVDVLVPEALGERADTTTVGSATAFPAQGVRQALDRTEVVPVTVNGEQVSWVPRPSLLGAIVAKAVASVVDHQDPERHHQDLAFLCGLVNRPRDLAEQTTRKDRKRLRRAAQVVPEDSPMWNVDPDARAAFEILIG